MTRASEAQILTKQQLAYRAVRRGILEGELRPGARLVISRLAEDLGMSAIPVREALSQLEREGLIASRPHAGAVVADVPLQAIEEIFALLEHLEVASARLGVKRLAASDHDALDDLAKQMDETRDPVEWMALNRRFHEALPRLADLPRIEEALVRAGEEWQRLRRLRFTQTDIEDIGEANRQHREFLQLLRQGQVGPLERWVRRHNRDALQRYLNRIM
ncbi:MAG: GntR family transcriptional regulator [Opitutales bacterium]